MKNLLMTAWLVIMLATMTTTAMAAEYEISHQEDTLFAVPTSVERITVVGGDISEQSNIDRSKNIAVIPPPFGSSTSWQIGNETALFFQVPALAPSAVFSGSGTTDCLSTEFVIPPMNESKVPSVPFTLPDDLYDSSGSIGQLNIPSLGVEVKVFEGESLENLAKGTGHFASTSCWDGNVGVAGHNRGVHEVFGQIHTLKVGDQITYTTRLGSRTYAVFYVGQIEETDFSRLGRTNENMITLITCVRDVRNMRWCIQAKEIV